MRLDESVEQAHPDEQTVTKEGSLTSSRIEGVIEKSPRVHIDHRGRLFEVFSGADSFWEEDIVFAHLSSIRTGCLKGWGMHMNKSDRYTLVCGEVLVVLWDARLDSTTHGLVQKVHLAPDSTRQLLIPAGVWHASVNLGQDEAYILDFPTEPYNHVKPDKVRLNEDSFYPPVDLRSFLPA